MKAGIMQPYLFPYLGYFQLINAVDIFVLLDDVQYIKQGWINRNQILIQHNPKMFTLPIKKDSSVKYINERYYNDTIFETSKKNLLDLIYHAYNRAPNFPSVFELIQRVLGFPGMNVAEFNANSLRLICNHLDIDTPFVVASQMGRNRNLNKGDAVIDMNCRVGADCCITPIGGKHLYSKEIFQRKGIDLWFLEMNGIVYQQFRKEFVPSLSMIDVMMFNSKERIRELLQCYTLS